LTKISFIPLLVNESFRFDNIINFLLFVRKFERQCPFSVAGDRQWSSISVLRQRSSCTR